MIKLETQRVMQFFVAGKPYAQTRARVGRNGAVYSTASDALKRWKASIRTQIGHAKRATGILGVHGALCVDLVFYMPTEERERWGELHELKPDKDNLEKAVLDVMAACGLFGSDDSQVAVGQTVKVWCCRGDEGVKVELSRARVKKAPAGGNSEGDGVDWLAGS